MHTLPIIECILDIHSVEGWGDFKLVGVRTVRESFEHVVSVTSEDNFREEEDAAIDGRSITVCPVIDSRVIIKDNLNSSV